MQYFLEFCYDTFVRKKEPIKKQSPEQSPPSSPRQLELYSCCNFLCFSTTKRLVEWKHVKMGPKRYFFCTHECWNEWLKNPNHMGSWSPAILSKEQIDEIETFHLDGPKNQSTILNAGCDIDLSPGFETDLSATTVFEDI